MHFRSLLIGLAISYSSMVHASVTAHGDTLFIEGILRNSDADRVVELINENKIANIIFKNSPGGEWRAGMRIGNFIAGKKVTTVVEGMCASACALAFLGGEKRKFSYASDAPIIFFHAPFMLDDLTTVETLKHAYFSWIEQRTHKQIPAKFLDAINNTVSSQGGVFLFSADDPIVKSKAGSITQICRGNETKVPRDCEKTEAMDAVSLGIINAQN